MSSSLTAMPDTDYLQHWHVIEINTQSAKQKYGARFRPLFEYHVNVSVFGLVMFVTTVMTLFFVRRYALMQRYSQWVAIVLWIALPC